jgi:hypothetical protein
LKAFQTIDAPADPHTKIRSWFPYLLRGLSENPVVNDQVRRQYRLKQLEINESDLVSACVQYLEHGVSRTAIIGNKDEVPEDIKGSAEWIVVTEEDL